MARGPGCWPAGEEDELLSGRIAPSLRADLTLPVQAPTSPFPFKRVPHLQVYAAGALPSMSIFAARYTALLANMRSHYANALLGAIITPNAIDTNKALLTQGITAAVTARQTVRSGQNVPWIDAVSTFKFFIVVLEISRMGEDLAALYTSKQSLKSLTENNDCLRTCDAAYEEGYPMSNLQTADLAAPMAPSSHIRTLSASPSVNTITTADLPAGMPHRPNSESNFAGYAQREVAASPYRNDWHYSREG
ncbi:hypothetical protein P7C73_g5370, partial [Tremellales sp. Uapishka_1]